MVIMLCKSGHGARCGYLPPSSITMPRSGHGYSIYTALNEYNITTCHHVVAIEIDPNKVALALHNAKIYGVEDRIDFIVADFFQLAPFLKGDVVFLSPPWGGPSYKAKEKFTLDLLKPRDGHSLFQVAQAITPNIIMYLPRNVDMPQAIELSWLSSPPLDVEVEENFVRGNSKGITIYFGDIA